MLGFAPIGANALGEYAETTTPTAPTFVAPLTLASPGIAQALGDAMTGSTANTTTPGTLTGTGIRLTLATSLTTQAD